MPTSSREDFVNGLLDDLDAQERCLHPEENDNHPARNSTPPPLSSILGEYWYIPQLSEL